MSISHADFAYNRPGSLRDAAVAGWFLGPKGENKEVLSDLFTQALDEHVSFRNQYFPEDPYYITDEVKEQPAYVGAVAKLRDESQKLFQRLKNSVPFYSMRYQGHMLWDITMPGMVGYHAAMFYNQNNTAVEASPVTTALEYRVGFDLAKMLGYQVGDSIDGSSGLPKAGPKSSHLDEAALAPEKTPQPWGHVTCDGTVANLESLWAARNLKYFPLSFQMALKNPALASASNFTVPVWDIATGKKKNRKVLSLSTWELLNLDVDDVLALTERLSSPPYNISSQIISDAMAPYNIQYAGISELHRLFGIRKTPVYIVTQSCHYSWPKAGSVLGLGMNNMIKIPVDKKGRMDMNSLHKTLTDLISPADPADRTAVIMVMGIAGSTEESCVDPIADILSMRKEFQTKLGFSYYVHCDGAWGGYFCSTMRKDDSTPPQPTDHIESFLHACNEGEGSSSSANAAGYVPFLPLSRYTETQLNALSHCDSITIDPHKSGYIQYPAGGLVYRNGTTRTLITFDAPIVYKGQGDQTIGIYGIEGSKPGAAASACYLSHRVIGLNRNGYGRILGQANFSTKKMYCMLNTLAQEDDPFIIRTFTDFPKPLVDDHGSVKGLLEYLQKHVVDRTNSQIAQDSRAMETMRQLGPDLLINAFAINFKVPAPSSSDGEGSSSSSSMHHMSNGDSSMDMSCGPSHLVLNRDIDKANAVMTNLFNDLDMAYMVVDPDGGPAAPIQKYGVMRKPLFFTSSEFGSNKYGMAVDDLKKRLGFDPEEDTPLYFLVNTTMDPWQTSVQFTKMVARILRANILKSIGTVTDTPDTHGFLLVGQKTLYFKHFPMFCAPPHQYMITIRVDFSNDEDRKKYLDKQKEDPNKVLVLANHDESILHDIVYRDPTSPLPVDCYFGMPPTGPPTVPFMEAALLIKDFIIYEHFDVKAQYPERLTYLMYGTGDEVHIEHYISKMKSFDHVCTLAAPPCGIDEERFKAGMFIQFNKPDGYYTENPLKEQDEWEFTYAGDGGVELNSKLTIARHVWFDPNRVNVMD